MEIATEARRKAEELRDESLSSQASLQRKQSAKQMHGKPQRSQAMVELAITLPLLALLLFGIIQYGLIFAAHITLRNASAVAARYATLTNPSPTINEIQDVARGAIGPMLATNHLNSPVVSTNVTIGSAANATSVSLTYNLPLMIPYVVPGASGNSLAITATTVMR